jgi:uncharacterized protein (DUF983 family)
MRPRPVAGPPPCSGSRCSAVVRVAAGDGPAAFAILLVGAVAVTAAVLVEVKLEPPLWVHAVLWPILVLPLSVWIMRVLKAALIGLQWTHRRALNPRGR